MSAWPWEDTAVAIPQIPSGSSGHLEQHGAVRSRIWTPKPAKHGAVRSRIWTPKPAVSQPRTWLGTLSDHLDSNLVDKDCVQSGNARLDVFALSQWPVGPLLYTERGESGTDVDSAVSFPVICDCYRIWSGRGRCHVTAGLVSSGVARIR